MWGGKQITKPHVQNDFNVCKIYIRICMYIYIYTYINLKIVKHHTSKVTSDYF